MLKKRLGLEAIERDWYCNLRSMWFFKTPSSIIIPDGCERIGIYAFYCNWLKEVEIPKSVKDIGISAFERCIKLREVVIPESVERIDDDAFWGCSSAIIILKKPRSEFKFIGVRVFDYCGYVKEEVRN